MQNNFIFCFIKTILIFEICCLSIFFAIFLKFQVLCRFERDARIPQILFWKRRHNWRCQGGLTERNYSAVSYKLFYMLSKLSSRKKPAITYNLAYIILYFNAGLHKTSIQLELKLSFKLATIIERCWKSLFKF